ncbi:MAG: hypothetical protein ACREQ8_10375 [Woeseiaceae bacterium]
MADGIDRGRTVTEVASMDPPVDALSETTAAFIGRALRGPLDTPVLLGGFGDFRRRFGGLWHRSSLGPAVEQFFEHGGQRLYVVRVANNARGAMICIPAAHGVLVLRALEPGSTESIRAAVDYDRIDHEDSEHFNLTLQRVAPDTGLVVDQEIYRRLSCRDEDRGFIGNVLLTSRLARPQAPLPGGRPLPTTDPRNRFDPGYVGQVQAGSDGTALSDYDLIGSAVKGTGLFSLDAIGRFDLLYLPPPGLRQDPGPAAILAAERYCRRRRAMLIMDPPVDWNSTARAVSGIRADGYASPNILAYFPRMVCREADGSPPRPVGGAIAGLLCKHDRLCGPWQALSAGVLRFSRSLVPGILLGAEEVGRLVREGLNVIAGNTAGQAALQGSVSLARNSQMDRKFARLDVQRLCLSITNAIEHATRWAVFAPTESGLADRIHAQVHSYMAWLAGAGAFADNRFVIQCDALHTAAADPRRGVTILLAFQPVGAGEVVSLTLQQTVSGCRVSTTAFAPSIAQCA